MPSEYDNLEWINSRKVGKAEVRPIAPPKVDLEVSQAVGKQIFVNDRRLIKLIAKWKQAKTDPEAPDEFLKDGAKVEEMRKVLNPERYKHDQA